MKNNLFTITKKFYSLIKIVLFIVKKPRQTIKLLAANIDKQKDYESVKKEYLENTYGYSQLSTIDLLDKNAVNSDNIFGVYTLAKFIDAWK